jgi:hypothetical protein
MQRKLLGLISVDFGTKGQLLIIYSAFVSYLMRNGVQWRSVSAVYILKESSGFSQEGGLV